MENIGLTEYEKSLLINRFDEATKEKAKIDWLITLCLKYFTVQGIREDNISALGVIYKDKFKNKLLSYIVSSYLKWANVTAPKTDDISEADKNYFEFITDTTFDVIQEDSNFESEKSSIFDNYLIGTAVFKIRRTGDYKAPCEFINTNLSNVYLTKRRSSMQPDVFYLNENVNKYQLIETYGEEILGTEAITKMNDKDLINVWEACVYNAKDKNYLVVISKDSKFSQIISTKRSLYNPWIVCPFDRFGNSPYGAGPCIKALLEIMALIRTKKRIEEIGQKQMSPSYIYHGESKWLLRATVDKSGTVSRFGEDTRNQIVPFNRGEGADIAFFSIEDYDKILRDAFYINLIENISSVDDLKNITATATQVIVTELSRQIEPIYSLLQKEMLRKIIEKVMFCCEGVYKINLSKLECLKDNPKLKIRYYNAITIAQDNDDLDRSALFYQTIAQTLGQTAAIASVNTKEFYDNTKRRLRVPNKDFKSGAEVEQEVEEIMNNFEAPIPEGVQAE